MLKHGLWFRKWKRSSKKEIGQLFSFTTLKIVQDRVPSRVLVAVENLQNLPTFIREDLLQLQWCSAWGANSPKLNTWVSLLFVTGLFSLFSSLMWRNWKSFNSFKTELCEPLIQYQKVYHTQTPCEVEKILTHLVVRNIFDINPLHLELSWKSSN